MIYINATNSYTTRAKTGIQRVVRKLSERLLKNKDYVILVKSESDFYQISESSEINLFLEAEKFTPSKQIDLKEIKSGDIFFDIDASWGDAGSAEPIWRKIKSSGAIMVKMHYDAVPILFPQFSSENTVYRYIENFASALKVFDYWICISHTVDRDLKKLAAMTNCGIPQSFVFPLGADIQKTSAQAEPNTTDEFDVSDKKIILTVGTVEPRKNHELVLDVFDNLCKKDNENDMHLVIVGKPGWNNEGIINRIENHPLYNIKLHWLKNASDSTLNNLYQHTAACLCLSHYEGYGLPVVEALAKGAPVICSKDSAMEEVAQGMAISVTPTVDSVSHAIEALLENKVQDKNYEIKPITWDQSAEELEFILNKIQQKNINKPVIKQAVYISIRPQGLLSSLKTLHHAEFIKEIIVLTSDSLKMEMESLQQHISTPIKIVTESSIGLGNLPSDHQERNTTLRRSLYHCDFIDAHFLACDDDYHMIKPISEEVFIQNNKQIGYYFYQDGSTWQGAFPTPTSFDIGIWRTTAYLNRAGYSSLLFNSHQPQIIDKKIACEILDRTAGLGLDEWSIYFNIAMHLYPDRFYKKPYITAGWPGDFSSWLPSQSPTSILFFNDPPSSIDSNQADIEWIDSLRQAQTVHSQIQPEVPSIKLQANRLQFSIDSVQCPKGISFCIPIFSDSELHEVNYEFRHHKISYSHPNIPNFLHIVCGEVAENFKITAKFRTAITTTTSELEIHSF